LPILSDLLISRGIDPAGLDKHKRCDVCRKHGPDLHPDYSCSKPVCSTLWGDLADIYWKESEDGDGSGSSLREKLDPNRLTKYLR
jgi:hypothetical protein